MLASLKAVIQSLENWIDLGPSASTSDNLRARLLCIIVLALAFVELLNFTGAYFALGRFTLQHAVFLAVAAGVLPVLVILKVTKSPNIAGATFGVLALVGFWLSAYVDHAKLEVSMEVGAAYTPYMVAAIVLMCMVASRRASILFSAGCLLTLFAFYQIGATLFYPAEMIAQSRFGLVLRCSAIILTTTIMLTVSEVIFRTLEDLEQARDRAKAAELMKADFLSTMSHEIRTPLGGIISISDMLVRSDLPETERSYANILQRGAHSLMDIINDVLDMAKLETGRVEIAQDPFSPEQLLSDVVALFETKAATENLWIGMDAQGLPNRLIGDAPHLRQILNNLVSNAIKFTQEGGVRIGARLVNVDRNIALVQFYVQDSGYGISEDDQSKLFQRFEQTESAKTTTQAGSGLGLSICQDMANLMGGSIALQSAVGQGSTFHFTLRFPIAESRAALPDAA